MPAQSVAQQKLMGMAYALKKGDMKPEDASEEVKKLADEMTLDQLKDYAETKHEGLPAKKESKESSKKLTNIKTFEEFVAECDDETDEDENVEDEESVDEASRVGAPKIGDIVKFKLDDPDSGDNAMTPYGHKNGTVVTAKVTYVEKEKSNTFQCDVEFPNGAEYSVHSSDFINESESVEDPGFGFVIESALQDPAIFQEFKKMVEDTRVTTINAAIIEKIQSKLDELKAAIK